MCRVYDGARVGCGARINCSELGDDGVRKRWRCLENLVENADGQGNAVDERLDHDLRFEEVDVGN